MNRYTRHYITTTCTHCPMQQLHPRPPPAPGVLCGRVKKITIHYIYTKKAGSSKTTTGILRACYDTYKLLAVTQ